MAASPAPAPGSPAPRLLIALLAVSLLGNAALLLVPRSAPSATDGSLAGRTEAGFVRPSSPPSSPPSEAPPAGDIIPPEVTALLNSGDPERLHAALLAAGVDEEIREQIVHRALWRKYESRFKALGADGANDPSVWWKDTGNYDDSAENRRINRERNLLHRQLTDELQRITGRDPYAYEPENNLWLARQYGGLPFEKAAALHRMERDYEELLNEINLEAGSFELPSDQAKRALIEAERERDRAALLSPDELADWELRNSPTADRLRYRMGRLDATEEEYRRIYALQKAFDREFNQARGTDPFANPAAGDPSVNDPAYADRREAAEARLEADIRAIIGEDRHLAAALENDLDFTNARAAAARLGLPPETAPRVHALREPAAAESRRIAADPLLSLEQKKAGLGRLAAATREEVTRILGAEAAQTYFERGSMSWLRLLEDGASVTVSPGGGYESFPLGEAR